MKYTFYLRDPKAKKSTSVLFAARFKEENKKFVYSTGERVNPDDWNARTNKAKTEFRDVNSQLERYRSAFESIESMCLRTKEEFTVAIAKEHFDNEFKKTTKKLTLYDAFDNYILENVKMHDWSDFTRKRYQNTLNNLKRFEKARGYKVSFSSMNKKFLSEWTDYSVTDLKHIDNTRRRNLQFLKTFLAWAVKEKLTYKTDFKDFSPPKESVKRQVALRKEDLQKLLDHSFKDNLERVRDVFVFACVTGLRYSELKLVRKETIDSNHLIIKEEKGTDKAPRRIPMSSIAWHVLRKYDSKLPVISNQKYNKYIKVIFEQAGFDKEIEDTIIRGKIIERPTVKFFEKCSSHTSRRSFITMMKRKGFSNKVIMEMTGQKDLRTINTYYQIDDDDKQTAINETFDLEFKPLKRA